MTSEINYLKEITEKLPPFPDSIDSNIDGSDCETYEMDEGVCFAWNLYWIPQVSVTRWYNDAGSQFPKHHHKEVEVIVVYQGELHIVYENGIEKVVTQGEHVYHPPDTVHSAHTPVDTYYITVMIPASFDYPGADQE